MKTLFLALPCLVLITSVSCNSQVNYSWQKDKLILDNGAIKRTIIFDKENKTFGTTSLYHGTNEINFLSPEACREFSFDLNGINYTGQDSWEYLNHVSVSDNNGGNGLTVTLKGMGELSSLEMDITYILYPSLPVIRKYITFRNTGNTDLKIESLDIENLNVGWGDTHSWIFRNYARQKHLGTYVGDWDDPLVVLHDYHGRKGIALGNEAPGVTKRIAYHTDKDDISIGLTHTGQDYAFRKWILPKEEWKSPEVFIATYDNAPDATKVINTTVNDYTRNHMGIRLMEIKTKPVFVYNTWNPFRHNINEKLINELTDAASESGIEEFIIDDGWQRNYTQGKDRGGPVGDWLINEEKFPNGLSPVFQYIKEKGMKPGLWMSIGSAHDYSRVFTEHNEWFVKDKNGNLANLHTDWDAGLRTSCFSTDWPDYIRSKLLGLVNDHGLEYAKLDFSIVTSAYVTDPERSGCYAKDHPYHKDVNESYLNNYNSLLKLFDDLHKEAPDLFIDCTFETVGKLQLIDYATVKHAEGDWLSNFESPSPMGALRVRNMAWWRTPVMPAGACVIGNLRLDSKDLEFDFLSTVGTLPIVLGDPRKLSTEDKKMLKSWSTWMRSMQDKYNYMVFRQDLTCFGEPTEGHWDGWARINTDTQEGGIIGVFRQGAVEKSRIVTIDWLKADVLYTVIDAVDERKVVEMSGGQLKREGFEVVMDKEYQGKLFEIRKLQ